MTATAAILGMVAGYVLRSFVGWLSFRREAKRFSARVLEAQERLRHVGHIAGGSYCGSGTKPNPEMCPGCRAMAEREK